MKKTALLFAFVAAAFVSNAQVTLSGTSYSQNFDNIGAAQPAGWAEYYGATSTSLGTIDAADIPGTTTYGAYWDTLDCPSDVFGHGFKNCASADNGWTMSTATCFLQESQTNRALGVRQASNTSYPGYDPGPSFTFEIANTTGMGSFSLSFNLQTLDSICPRVTTWTVDYGIGATPSVFTPITTSPSVLTTGGSTFNNQAVTATLPSGFDNQSGPVWIRISTLTATTGSGLRTTSAIDDYMLTWGSTSVANVSAGPSTSLAVIGQATPDNVTLAYNVTMDGAYTLNIYDFTGRTLHTETINAQAGNQSVTVNGLHLVPGMYMAKMSNGSGASVARIAVQ